MCKMKSEGLHKKKTLSPEGSNVHILSPDSTKPVSFSSICKAHKSVLKASHKIEAQVTQAKQETISVETEVCRWVCK